MVTNLKIGDLIFYSKDKSLEEVTEILGKTAYKYILIPTKGCSEPICSYIESVNNWGGIIVNSKKIAEILYGP